MMKGDRRHIDLAYSLQFAMPGTPVLRYGEEIGVGENLSLPGREALRTPMQWVSDTIGVTALVVVLGIVVFVLGVLR